MISALFLALASLSAPVAGSTVSYGSSPVSSLKGHPALPVRKKTAKSPNAEATCHPDTFKGRACRHVRLTAANNPSDARPAYAMADEAKGAERSQ